MCYVHNSWKTSRIHHHCLPFFSHDVTDTWLITMVIVFVGPSGSGQHGTPSLHGHFRAAPITSTRLIPGSPAICGSWGCKGNCGALRFWNKNPCPNGCLGDLLGDEILHLRGVFKYCLCSPLVGEIIQLDLLGYKIRPSYMGIIFLNHERRIPFFKQPGWLNGKWGKANLTQQG